MRRGNIYERERAYEAEQHHALAARYGEDPGVVCLAWEAHALFLLGYPDQALHRSREAIALAKDLADAFSLVEALVLAAYTRLYRGEAHVAQEEAERALALAREHEFPFIVPFTMILWGWALAGLGKCEEGILQMRQGLAAYQATGAELMAATFSCFAGRTHSKRKPREPEWPLLDEALALIEKLPNVGMKQKCTVSKAN